MAAPHSLVAIILDQVDLVDITKELVGKERDVNHRQEQGKFSYEPHPVCQTEAEIRPYPPVAANFLHESSFTHNPGWAIPIQECSDVT